MIGTETSQRCFNNSSSMNNEGLKITISQPYNFTLYHDLSLRGSQIPLPYIYTKTNWKCIIRTSLNKYIPLEVIPVINNDEQHFIVNILSDYSTKEESEIKKYIMQVFCSDLNLSPFYQQVFAEDSELSIIIKKLIGLKPYLSQDPFESLIKAVIRQLVHVNTARHIMMLLVLHFGMNSTICGNNFYSFPSPEILSKADKNSLAQCKLGYKWRLVKQLSKDVVSGDLELNQLSKLSDEKIIERLEEYKGIGYWTSRIFLYDGLKRLNMYPIHDISLKKAISMIYYEEKSISWEKVDDFFANYNSYIGLASTYLFGALWLNLFSKNNLKNKSEELNSLR